MFGEQRRMALALYTVEIHRPGWSHPIRKGTLRLEMVSLDPKNAWVAQERRWCLLETSKISTRFGLNRDFDRFVCIQDGTVRCSIVSTWRVRLNLGSRPKVSASVDHSEDKSKIPPLKVIAYAEQSACRAQIP